MAGNSLALGQLVPVVVVFMPLAKQPYELRLLFVRIKEHRTVMLLGRAFGSSEGGERCTKQLVCPPIVLLARLRAVRGGLASRAILSVFFVADDAGLTR
jgi:hypothetical protein